LEQLRYFLQHLPQATNHLSWKYLYRHSWCLNHLETMTTFIYLNSLMVKISPVLMLKSFAISPSKSLSTRTLKTWKSWKALKCLSICNDPKWIVTIRINQFYLTAHNSK
jgi:hypothetical protein